MAYVLDLARAHVSDPMVPQMTMYHPAQPIRLPFRSVDTQLLMEGHNPPDAEMPATIYMKSNSKKFPALIPVHSQFYIVTAVGRTFFGQHAPDDVHFVDVEVYSVKRKAPVEEKFYWAMFHTRCDSIAFEQSDLDVVWVDEFYRSSDGKRSPRWSIRWRKKRMHGLVSRVADRRGSQIWKEILKGSNYADAIFVSDEMAEAIVREKICRSPDFIPVRDVD